eukprot:CAMPEP_0197272550 /NCGR_PEP_ID=MMETSP1432-20130617/10056_1 /TAXON_ID=44447 /ORGANISM="Pseudo-nitzschia delicatissima, Strain UNC1205" /LENGTH=394 /DNA_ID=CAMNT_0042738111 /DNA_START=140 /DNA_END=1324 /DNA_ORIENTATION=+
MPICCIPMRSTISIFLLLALWVLCVHGFASEPQSSKNPVRVLVTGAAGNTGRIVLSKLGHDRRYEPKGLFRTEKSARSIVKSDATIHLEHVVVADVTSSTFLQDLSGGTIGKETNDDASESSNSSNGLENLEAMIICTSAVPRIRKRSLVAMLVKAPWRALKGESLMDVHSMRFAWKHGGYPEKVDYKGQIAQIDLAKQLGIPHVILISSMGGTNPDNFLNSVGPNGHGGILKWKREAEKYLVESGLDYTILHPGHLVDAPGGFEEYVLGVDDELYELNHQQHKIYNSTEASRGAATRISREDVAELCVAALSAGKDKKISFDCITMSSSALSSSSPPQKLHKTKRRKRPFRRKSVAEISDAETRISAESRKPAEEVLYDFLDLSISTNYDLVA